MYEQSRIIRTPISNNRLNYGERENKSIVVPSLIEGTLDEVQLSEEIVIEAEVDGKIVAGKGLKHFVFLKNSKVPTWICDNHNHAFVFWHDAFQKGYIQRGSRLIHIDQHTDLATPNQIQSIKYKIQNSGTGINIGVLEKNNPSFCPLSSVFCTLDEVEEYTNTVLTIADFIVPALATGLISEAVMVTGEEREGAGTFIWENNELKKLPTERNTMNEKQTTIVDIDLDYFSQGFDEKKTLATTKYWIERADIITIATSPLFINQEKALEYLRKLF